jgi:hypothetical protein
MAFSRQADSSTTLPTRARLISASGISAGGRNPTALVTEQAEADTAVMSAVEREVIGAPDATPMQHEA